MNSSFGSFYNTIKVKYSDTLSQTEAVQHALLENKNKYRRIIETNRFELLPLATGVSPQLNSLQDIRLVLFDIYGTLLISGSGEVGSIDTPPDSPELHPDFFSPISLAGFAVTRHDDSFNRDCQLRYIRLIRHRHEQLKKRGVKYPEVDILSIWHRLLSELLNEGIIVGDIDEESLIETSLRYELTSNRCWTMPGALTMLETFKKKGTLMGIVSNAQFYTSMILESFINAPLAASGFHPEIMCWSFLHSRAKPSLEIFRGVNKFIHKHGIEPHQVVYIGNDMLNDVLTARKAGFKSVLFAGDRRSLRMREEKEELQTVRPDAIITELMQLAEIIRCTRNEE